MATIFDCTCDCPHPFTALTVTLPVVELPVALILFVVEVPVQPVGRPHTYEVAPATVSILKVAWLPLQILSGPLMAPGVAGTAPVVTVNVYAVELPQALLAVTVIVPAPDGVTLILSAVEVPVQPLGKFQV